MNSLTNPIPAENVFSLEGKGLKLTTAADAQPYIDLLKAIPKLELIQLNGNTIGPEAAKALAAALKDQDALKVALLHDIFTGRLREDVKAAVKHFCDALVDKPDLVELNLSDNAFGPIGAESMFDFIVKSPALQTLKINNNGLGIQGGRLIAQALTDRQHRHAAEGKPSTLRCLVAGRNRLENGSSKALADAFAAHGTFTEIRLPQNGIRPEGIRILSLGLTNCPNLQVLDLQDNTFTATGSLAMAEAIASWPQLRVLNLGDCLLGPKGGVAIASSLKESSHKLETLLLGYNEIEQNGALILSQAIGGMPHLASLDLNGNRFDPDCDAVTQIRSALEDIGHEDALGSLSDMEELSDEEEESEEESELSEAEEEPEKALHTATDDAVEKLAKDLAKDLEV
ncbi:Ran GAP Rna1 [Dimargaris xerosporica]|nr:Ran GAP Rna1 [Dimargaris xerosporica]